MWQQPTPDTAGACSDGPRVLAVVAASASLVFLGTGAKQGRGEGKTNHYTLPPAVPKRTFSRHRVVSRKRNSAMQIE
jgi:hypothetical protein